MTQHDDEDLNPDEDELREAEALARALERGHASPETPGPALEAAALLRFSKDDGKLHPERAKALFDDAMERARPRVAARARFRFFGLLGLAAGAAALVLVTLSLRTSEPDVRAQLPSPPRSLLTAQAEALGSHGTSLDAVSKETASYRVAVYTALRERYER